MIASRRLSTLIETPLRNWVGKLALLALVALLGCAGDGPATPAKPESAVATDGPSADQMKAWWALYQRSDPKWPAARERWSAASDSARQTLILSLTRELIQKAPVQSADGKLLYRVPQTELLALPASDVVPILIEMMRVSKDRSATDVLGDTLAECGAIDPVAAALDSARPDDSPLAVIGFLRTLVRIGGDRALGVVSRRMQEDANWQNRSAAAEALRLARSSDKERAARALLPALTDSDAFVVRQALRSIEVLAEVRVAPDVARAFARFQAGKDTETMKQTVVTLRSLTGRSVPGDDAARWLEVAQSAAESAR